MTEVARVSRSSDSVSSCMQLAQLHVEAGERLVHEHHRRARDDGAGERHALLLAAGKDVRVFVGEVRQPDALQRRQRLARRVGLGQRLEAEGDVAEDRQVREEREILEHQADAARLRGDEARRPRHLEPVDQHPSGGRLLDAGGDAQQRRLSAARRPEQANDLRRCDVEVDAGQRLRLVVVAGDVLEGELRGKGGGGAPLAVAVPIGSARLGSRHAGRGLNQRRQRTGTLLRGEQAVTAYRGPHRRARLPRPRHPPARRPRCRPAPPRPHPRRLRAAARRASGRQGRWGRGR